jgi:hypothetical protein
MRTTNYIGMYFFSYDSLTIYDGGSSTSSMMGKYCDNSIPPSQISSSNEILVHFETDWYDSNSKGFQMVYNPYSKLVNLIFIKSISVNYFLLVCNNAALVGNGFCNDETNIAACNYDSGDCCGSCVLIEYCSNCDCLGGLSSVGSANPLIGNGFCNEQTNNLECDYDGGDCCSNPEMVGNGFCDEETNNIECVYDGGDCCGPDVSCK